MFKKVLVTSIGIISLFMSSSASAQLWGVSVNVADKTCVYDVSVKWEAFWPYSSKISRAPLDKLCRKTLSYSGFEGAIPSGNLVVSWKNQGGDLNTEYLPIQEIFKKTGATPNNIEIIVASNRVEVWNTEPGDRALSKRLPLYTSGKAAEIQVWEIELGAPDASPSSALNNFKFSWGPTELGGFNHAGAQPRRYWGNNMRAIVYDEKVPAHPLVLNWTTEDGTPKKVVLNVAEALKQDYKSLRRLQFIVKNNNIEVWETSAKLNERKSSPHYFSTNQEKFKIIDKKID